MVLIVYILGWKSESALNSEPNSILVTHTKGWLVIANVLILHSSVLLHFHSFAIRNGQTMLTTSSNY